MTDNWQDRSIMMKCRTCISFVVKRANDKPLPLLGQDGVPIATPSKDQTEKNNLGRCRKHAPTLNGWPAVFETDWCGDHKLDENKI